MPRSPGSAIAAAARSGAATAHKRLASLGLTSLKKRKVVIWVLTSVTLTREWEKWDADNIPSRLPGFRDYHPAMDKVHREMVGDGVPDGD